MKDIWHLHWRAGFGFSPQEWTAKSQLSRKNAVDSLFEQTSPTFFEAKKIESQKRLRELSADEKLALIKDQRRNVFEQSVEWVEQMGSMASSPLLERMTLFWHGHFACKTKIGGLATQQLNAIRAHALGSFRDLLIAIAKDPSMIRFLNNQQNIKSQPNENFARELLELFTIGRGNYTESDIKEAARAFTGWSSNIAGDFVFRQFQHDNEPKTFFGKTGRFDGTDIIDIILEDRRTAQFICRKVYAQFVNETIDTEIVEELSIGFYKSDYNIGKLMRTIFDSDWFYEEHNIRAKIKSPIELVSGMIRSLNISFENKLAIVILLRALGQIPFNPPNVAGWPGGRSWIDNATLMLRLNLPAAFLNKGEIEIKSKEEPEENFGEGRLKQFSAVLDFSGLEQTLQGKSDQQCFDFLNEWLLLGQATFSFQEIERYIQDIQQLTPTQAITMLLMSTPEFQLC